MVVTMPAWWVVLVCVPAGPIADRALRLWSRLVLRASCRVRLTGAEFLQRTDSMMLVSNHASYIDSVVLMAVLPAQALAMEAIKTPGYSCNGDFPVSREKSRTTHVTHTDRIV
jgi:fatty-acyl-CoA synthase